MRSGLLLHHIVQGFSVRCDPCYTILCRVSECVECHYYITLFKVSECVVFYRYIMLYRVSKCVVTDCYIILCMVSQCLVAYCYIILCRVSQCVVTPVTPYCAGFLSAWHATITSHCTRFLVRSILPLHHAVEGF